MDIINLTGIGPSRAKLLHNMGIYTVNDLANCLPRDYDDRSQIKTISMLTPGTTHTIRCTVTREAENIVFNVVMTKLRISDETGELEIIWFGQPYLKKQFKKNAVYMFTGRVKENYGRLQMESPEYEMVEGGVNVKTLSAGRIVPIYTLPKGISQKMFRKWMKSALDKKDEKDRKNSGIETEETLPEELRSGFVSRWEAIKNIHFPESGEHFHAARRRLVFEELFFMQLALLQLKGAPQPGIKIENTDMVPFLEKLPFALTSAQKSVLDEICRDMKSGNRMGRLIQGDVGSGKTVVAAAAAYLVISAGYQVAVMAPTEVLAKQHYKKQYFENPILLTGSLPPKEKKAALVEIKKGRAKLIIGTHALIQEGVEFHNLALVITDEQHRFGVNQRAALSEKGICNMPHIMIMTATPIPRTLGLILYGDMDISVIDTLPPGRMPIKTHWVNSSYRSRLTAFMAKQVREGHQVYVICPAIGETDGPLPADSLLPTDGPLPADGLLPTDGPLPADIQAVISYTARLQEALPDIPIACLHGRLKEKDEIMTAFSQGRIPIIVSTTVIEVGVDVPNATLIVIENAERFGLAQLHQLRGRVGRGTHQSYCVLVTDSKTEQTLERMKAMESTTDGFVLSELDLKMRGPGDFFGVRQHGLPAFTIANLYRDMDILKEAQKAAQRINLKMRNFTESN